MVQEKKMSGWDVQWYRKKKGCKRGGFIRADRKKHLLQKGMQYRKQWKLQRVFTQKRLLQRLQSLGIHSQQLDGYSWTKQNKDRYQRFKWWQGKVIFLTDESLCCTGGYLLKMKWKEINKKTNNQPWWHKGIKEDILRANNSYEIINMCLSLILAYGWWRQTQKNL